MTLITRQLEADLPGKFNPAAVLLPFFEEKGKLKLIFTKRSLTVQHHKGQICFPGGGTEGLDKNLWQTALRETKEEIGIAPSQVFYISELPKLKTPSMFEVTPFIGFVFPPIKLNPNPNEIDQILTIPFDHFTDKSCLRFEELEYFNKKFPIPFFKYKKTEIWGVTGRILLNLIDLWKI